MDSCSRRNVALCISLCFPHYSVFIICSNLALVRFTENAEVEEPGVCISTYGKHSANSGEVLTLGVNLWLHVSCCGSKWSKLDPNYARGGPCKSEERTEVQQAGQHSHLAPRSPLAGATVPEAPCNLPFVITEVQTRLLPSSACQCKALQLINLLSQVSPKTFLWYFIVPCGEGETSRKEWGEAESFYG